MPNVADSSSCSSALHRIDEPFADLQRDVAGEPVADDHVDVARKHVRPSTLPTKSIGADLSS